MTTSCAYPVRQDSWAYYLEWKRTVFVLIAQVSG